MRLKHWKGYGTIDAKKMSLTNSRGIRTLRVRITGNHEYGIVTRDPYTIANWLVKRFDKSFTELTDNTQMNVEAIPGILADDTDICDYIITYQLT